MHPTIFRDTSDVLQGFLSDVESVVCNKVLEAVELSHPSYTRLKNVVLNIPCLGCASSGKDQHVLCKQISSTRQRYCGKLTSSDRTLKPSTCKGELGTCIKSLQNHPMFHERHRCSICCRTAVVPSLHRGRTCRGARHSRASTATCRFLKPVCDPSNQPPLQLTTHMACLAPSPNLWSLLAWVRFEEAYTSPAHHCHPICALFSGPIAAPSIPPLAFKPPSQGGLQNV